MKSYKDVWAISLLVVGCVTLILAITNFADIDMLDNDYLLRLARDRENRINKSLCKKEK